MGASRRSRGGGGDPRAELAPQLAAYTGLGRTARWVPFLMVAGAAEVRSEVVNTDRFGFRWSVRPDGGIASVESPPEEPCGVLVGSSTAFGVGATRDATSLPSLLAHATGRPWLNLAGRAYGSTQELLAFLLHADRLPEVREIVILSGLNDLWLQFASNRFDEQLGAFFEGDRYAATMARGDRRWRGLLAGLARRRRRPGALLERRLEEREERREHTLALVRRNLAHWLALAAQRSARVVYALQPTLPWVGKPPTPEERELLAGRRARDPRREMIFDRVLATSTHAWYAEGLRQICADLGLPFVDVNAGLGVAGGADPWLFVDRVHMTDAGYAACADCLAVALR